MPLPSLPAESLERLATLAAITLGLPGDEVRAVQVQLLAAPAPFPDEGIACADVAAPGWQGQSWTLPPGATAYAAVALTRAADGDAPPTSDDRDPVICIFLPSRRDWSDADMRALRSVAATAAVELRLRGDTLRLERATEEARTFPLHDPLTELAHRELFLDRVGMTLLRSARYQDRHFAVMSLSVEQFGHIETGFGYDAAHEVLREFANRLRGAVRGYDSISRLAGDEFGILLESIRDLSDAARVANRVHESLRVPIKTRWEEFMVSANVGIVLSQSGIDSAARLIQLAGLARERARNGGTAYEIFDPSMQQHARTRLQREMELRSAVEARQFDLHYQPIVSLADGRVTGVEALLRWNHPRRGLVSAGDFIGLAEETGLAVPLGSFALRRASDQVIAWRDMPALSPLTMSVNVTAAQFRHRDVAQELTDVIGSRHHPGAIHLEVTERMLIGDPTFAKEVLETLRRLGIRIHLDDFGTGYSSLQYLHELPLDAIKIDRGFVARLPNGGRDAQLVTTIRELARQLGVPVIAEGVETPEHLALVRDLGCEFAQGYFFSRPIPAAELEKLVANSPRW